MLSFAQKQENDEQEKEIIKLTLPLWLINYAVSNLRGIEPMSYADYMRGIKDSNNTQTKKDRTAEQILAEFAPLIEGERGG